MIPFYRKLSFKISIPLLIVVLLGMAITATQIATIESKSTSQLMIDKGRLAALAGAKAYGVILEAGVDSGEITLESLLEPKYVEIKYDVVVEHRRYHTGFDTYTDNHGIQAIQDSFNDPDIVYSSGADRFGYVPTPHARYDHDPTGDKEKDAANSRKKRKYEEPVIQSAVRFLGSPGQTTLVQEYWRKPGGLTWDVAAPITVHGHHFGAFRVGVRADQIESRKWAFIARMGIWFCLLAAGVVIAVFALLSIGLRPLNRLTAVAKALGDWEGDKTENEHILNPVTVESRDEVGALAMGFERVRKKLIIAKRKIDSRSGRTTPHTRV